MSVTKRVERINIVVARDNSQGSLSMGEVAVRQCHSWLQEIAKAFHRGPTDTWTAARDRAASAAGIEPSYAARIWHRSQSMKDVSGGAYRRLEETYKALCLRAEAFESIQAIEAERIALEAAEILAARLVGRDEKRMGSSPECTREAPQPQARTLPPH